MSEQKLVYFSSKNQDVSNDKQTIKHKTASHWTVEKNWEPLASMDEVRGEHDCIGLFLLTVHL